MTSIFQQRFQLKPFLLEALQKQNLTRPTEIQERLIPSIQNGVDAIGQSQTGSGKTLAFLLPIINNLDPNREELQAIITAPTRELANQIYQEALKLLENNENEIRAKLVVGGTDRKRMIDMLKRKAHLIIGTPGRIKDLVKDEALNVFTARILVVDEADQMLDMGFIEDVDQVAARMAEKLQMLVFSATIPENLQPFLRKYMTNPKHVQVKPQHATAQEIEHIAVPLKHRDKMQLVVQIAEQVNPYLAIIFTNTKLKADEVANAMLREGLNTERLHGGLEPRARKNVMKKVAKAECQYVVATDLAARGIDIKGITHIINFELPKDLDFYIHRVGRTGRAGADGMAITIYDEEDMPALRKLEARGISFHHKDTRNNEWINITIRNRQPSKRKTVDAISAPKPKKVKPGYKKKWREENERLQRRNRRK
jgi:ATP-dependent RNA helicase CshB